MRTARASAHLLLRAQIELHKGARTVAHHPDFGIHRNQPNVAGRAGAAWDADLRANAASVVALRDGLEHIRRRFEPDGSVCQRELGEISGRF